ncbi:MAG: hypothetical protein F2840_13975 [Actinobacteria bacterium]|uniref:Unannotated protein n=1 Tax=freshwater metagenome TaxID=449393 RepID=A0A6J7LLE4_9ZZZZ|nr:hypothetical protein [Actinomycetota bacterium]
MAIAGPVQYCGVIAAALLALTMHGGSPVRAADVNGVARMHACTPPSSNFVSLEVAPEVTGAIPISAGMHRLWDLGVTWKDVNPAAGSFTWTALDAQVAKAEAAGSKPLLVLGMTPQWAAANPSAGDPRWGAGTSSPPRDINDWKAYVTAIVDRYGSRIAAYELWNEANLSTFWTGTADQMADLTAAAYPIIKAKQPDAIVLLPSVTLRLRASMRKFVGPFLAALGTRGFPFDGFAIHSYPAGNLSPQDRVNDIVYWQSTVVNQLGADSPVLDRLIFDTEVNYGLAGPGATPGRSYSDAEGASIIQQTYLDSQSLGIDATFWYLYTATSYSLLGVQLWSGTPDSLTAWSAIRRTFSPGTSCPAAGAPSPFETDRKLAVVAGGISVESGKASVFDNGVTAVSVAPPTIAGSRLTTSSAGWTLSTETTTVQSTAPFGAGAGSSVAVVGSGYSPGTTVYLWFTEPSTFLSATTADANGAFSTKVTIPAGASAGNHVLQVNGFTQGASVRSASIGLRVFAKATSPAKAVLTFPSGKRNLDASARAALRDLVATVPKGVRTTTVVAGEMHKSDADTGKLARKRAKKVVAYLKKAGLAGPFDITVSAVPKSRDSNHVRVGVTWGT